MGRPTKEAQRVKHMERLLDKSLKQLDEGLKDARAFDAARTAGILVEKIQLLKGKPTNRIEMDTPMDELKRRVLEVARARVVKGGVVRRPEVEDAAVAAAGVVQAEGRG